ncbi:MAG: hydroxyacid dehydrogenase [Lentisphaerae bacterium]|nr:hydroxyacid dehydrogenase [Lentisphaerota bacterium]
MTKFNGAFVNVSTAVDRVYGERNIARLHELCNMKDGVFTPEDVENGKLEDIDVIFSTWGMPCFTEAQMAKLPNLKAVFYAAGATDSFCKPLFEHNVRLFSAWRANAIPVAEFALAQIILGLKNYFNISANLKTHGSFLNGQEDVTYGMYGARVALLGAGEISTHLQKLLKNFNVEVIVVPSHPERRTISLEEAFATSQVISNHFPNRDDNVGVFNRKMFASMKPGAVFINTGRGRQVNEDDLISVLEERPDLTACLDVTYPEPPVEGSKLYTLPNVHLSPHIAGSLKDELYRMSDYMVEEFIRFANGEEAVHEVKPSMLLTSK